MFLRFTNTYALSSIAISPDPKIPHCQPQSRLFALCLAFVFVFVFVFGVCLGTHVKNCTADAQALGFLITFAAVLCVVMCDCLSQCASVCVYKCVCVVFKISSVSDASQSQSQNPQAPNLSFFFRSIPQLQFNLVLVRPSVGHFRSGFTCHCHLLFDT